jgi:glucose/mannose-6-phosphate isomerase
VTLLAGLLERAGLLALSDAEVLGAADHAAAAVGASLPEVPTERNPAKRLAWSLVDRLPVVEASGFLAPVARRWKTQLNENGKSMAAYEELPEATHNTVVGYGRPESVRDHLHVVFLASSFDHPRNDLRAALSRELLGVAGISHDVVTADGPDRLAQALSVIVLGDFASVYLGVLYGVDPTPVDAIAHVKASMIAGAGEQDGDDRERDRDDRERDRDDRERDRDDGA